MTTILETAKRLFGNVESKKTSTKVKLNDIGKATKAFNFELQEIAKRAGGNTIVFNRKVMCDLLAEIITFQQGDTHYPVDTGRSRAAWLPYLKKNGVETNTMAIDAAAEAEGLALGTYKEVKATAKSSVTVTNSVDYTIYLEYGSSKQAPNGFVRRAYDIILKELEGTF